MNVIDKLPMSERPEYTKRLRTVWQSDSESVARTLAADEDVLSPALREVSRPCQTGSAAVGAWCFDSMRPDFSIAEAFFASFDVHATYSQISS